MKIDAFKKKWKNPLFKVKVIFHFLYFSILIGILFGGYNYHFEDDFNLSILKRDIFEISLITLLTYLFYYSVFKKDLLLIHQIKWALAIILILAFFAFNKASDFLYPQFNPNNLHLERAIKSLSEYIGFGTMLFLLLWGVDNVYRIFNFRVFEAQKALKDAENKLLRQQLNPHFLFNAFNSLYSMSLSQHPKTPDTILKLSNMMRYLTDNSSINKVKLSNELKFIHEYISIEKVRFGNQANIQFKIEGNPEGIQIEPLLLITLVENAFKHGFYTNDNNAFVHITAVIKEHSLFFEVKNSIQSKQHFQNTDRKGKGLNNLKKRLQLSYKKTSELNLIEKKDVFLAQLKIYF